MDKDYFKVIHTLHSSLVLSLADEFTEGETHNVNNKIMKSQF